MVIIIPSRRLLRQVGLLKWRIEQFKVVPSKQPPEEFYSGDSYILLNTYKDKRSDKLHHDLHFWLGLHSTQDEVGTAAYKSVELDTYLNDLPVQHREIQGRESKLFLSYFKEAGGIRILEGGVDSGFNHVKPEEYKPRLLWIKGKKNVRISEAPLKLSSLNEGDVFILDEGLLITQWNGKDAGKDEKARGAVLCRTLDDQRKGKPEVLVIEQGDQDCPDFYKKLEGTPADIKKADEVPADDEWESEVTKKRLFRLSDESKQMEFTLVSEGEIRKDQLDGNDVFIVDAGPEILIWVGKKSSRQEKAKAMTYAQDYIAKYERPSFLPITRIMEGAESEYFWNFFDA